RASSRRYLFFSASFRVRSSCARSSGVNSAPKSSASKTWRSSTSHSWPGKGLGQRLSQSMASCLDFTFQIQKPATSSFVSAKGPSTTVRLLSRENFTRAPLELGCNPSPACMTPAFTSSSLKRPMSARSFSSGITPASESFVAFTITMNRMFDSFSGLKNSAGFARGLVRHAVDLEVAAGPHFDGSPRGARDTRGDLDRLVEIARLDEVETGHHFLRLGEGAVRQHGLPVANPHARRGSRGLERFGLDELPAREEPVVELEMLRIERIHLLLGHRGELLLIVI